MLDKWRNYAIKNGKVKSCYQREYCNRKKFREAGETSDSNRNVESREVQTKEEIGGKSNGQSEIGIRREIQISGEISSEVRSRKPRGRRSSSRNEKVRIQEDGKDGSSREEKVDLLGDKKAVKISHIGRARAK